jgi:hypothetical protein
METIILTSENIHKLGTNGVGFTNEQLKLLGVPLPKQTGWLKKLIGTKISVVDYQMVMSLRTGQNNGCNEPQRHKERKPRKVRDMMITCASELSNSNDVMTPEREKLLTDIMYWLEYMEKRHPKK